jgi:hypothetical protein
MLPRFPHSSHLLHQHPLVSPEAGHAQTWQSLGNSHVIHVMPFFIPRYASLGGSPLRGVRTGNIQRGDERKKKSQPWGQSAPPLTSSFLARISEAKSPGCLTASSFPLIRPTTRSHNSARLYFQTPETLMKSCPCCSMVA